MENENKKRNSKGFLSGFLFGVMTCLLTVSIVIFGKYFIEYVRSDLIRKAAGEQRGALAEGSASIVNSSTIEKLTAIEEIIDENYYKTDVSKEQLETGIFKGLVAALEDPYSEYYSADELIQAHAGIEGVTYGIGAYIGYDEDKELTYISGIMEGSPAEEADLREGDYIVRVDDEDVQRYTSSEVVALVRGQENTPVQLTVYREGETDFIEFDLIRKKVLEQATVIPSVIEEGIGYVHITEFDGITVDQYTEAMAVLKENDVKGMILDLRSNPGGNVASLTEIARKILPEGLIVYTEDRNGVREEYTCDGKNELQLPLVVLVNEYSASAAEILAAAVQDYQKGTVVGTATYGKGVVQRIINISDGTAVKLTVSSYYTPLGRSLGGVGVTPDVEIDLDRDALYDEGVDNQLEKAVEVLKEKMG